MPVKTVGGQFEAAWPTRSVSINYHCLVGDDSHSVMLIYKHPEARLR